MKAGIVHAKGDIRFGDIEKPEIEPGKVLIKVKYTGICGSDIPRVWGDACRFFPNVLGHEFSGTVEEVGEGVTDLKPGDRVAGVPLIPCFACEDCARGDYSLCKHYGFVGSRQFGSFAEYVLLPRKNAVRFDPEVSFEKGAFFEPATVAYHGLKRLNFVEGKSVAILGGGTIGLFTMQWAKIYGAKEVMVFDISPARLDLALKMGADGVFDSTTARFEKDALAVTGGGFDRIYETAGNEATIKSAFKLVKNKGGVCLIGTPTRDFSFTVGEWENLNRKEFTLTGSWMSYGPPFPGEEWEMTAHYFKKGLLKFDDSLIHEIVPLSRIREAFEMFATPGLVKGKILIDSER
ncbi:MAG: galactitol-1-phosphate 5-dehydrogenase [Deltaproteobacteria bacterium]|jgi:L-iditol 2-dehydrogenase|nr:galactitol-1-phosphate 5-dehydrogenase [Deltaproteobacteria bacterium]